MTHNFNKQVHILQYIGKNKNKNQKKKTGEGDEESKKFVDSYLYNMW